MTRPHTNNHTEASLKLSKAQSTEYYTYNAVFAFNRSLRSVIHRTDISNKSCMFLPQCNHIRSLTYPVTQPTCSREESRNPTCCRICYRNRNLECWLRREEAREGEWKEEGHGRGTKPILTVLEILRREEPNGNPPPKKKDRVFARNLILSESEPDPVRDATLCRSTRGSRGLGPTQP